MTNSAAETRKHVALVRQFLFAILMVSLHCALATGQTQTITVDSDAVLAVAFSSDGRTLAGGGFDKAIRLWDARTGKVLHSLEGPKRTTRRCIAFAPDGKTLAGSGDDGVVHFWNVRTGALERSISVSVKNLQHITSFAFSPDGAKLAIASAAMERKDGAASEVMLLDLKRGKSSWTKAGGKWVYSVAFSPDGKTLAAADDEVHLLDADTGAPIKSLGVKDRKALNVVFSPDGKSLAGAGGYWKAVGEGPQQISEVYLWDAQTGKLLRTITDLHPWLRCIAFSPDGNVLATGSSGPILQKGALSWVSSEIRLWDPLTGKLLRTIPGELSDVSSLAFSSDGKSLLSCDGDVVALTETLTGLRRLELMKRSLKPFSREK